MVAQSEPVRKLVTTGNIEIDKKIGGGLPPRSLTLVEGQSDAGKSVLVQQFVWGSLQSSLRVAMYTTENTTASLMRQMTSLSLGIDDFFLMGRINVFPVPNTFSSEKSNQLYRLLLNHIERMPQVDLVVVDSLTAFVTHASEADTLDFFSRAKDLCDSGRSLIVTMHSYASNEQLLTRLRSICDAHMRLRVEEVGTQLVKVLEVAKVRGADKSTGNIVSFDVEPNIGMRIIPIAKAKA
ncbi:MAG TPA: ATPase domain-containing protein [Dehalococcoidia bacterium]|jgi:flagellar protein FlaH|nr:ATPase domain-containing protein [Dehalococcoidia bacterium]